ncbi:tyrosine-type recombinase/integrase [Persephonella sp.]
MVKLTLKGNFVIEEELKELLDYYFKGKFYRKGRQYVIPGSLYTYRKIVMNFPEKSIHPTCYLYPIIEADNISKRTKRLYFQINKSFIEFIGKKPEEVQKKDIQAYIDYLIKKKKRLSTIKTSYMALRLFYEKMMGYLDLEDIQIPKNEENIPDVLTRKEVMKLIKSIKNHKHKLIVQLAYSCGLKLKEVINIKVKDIDFERGKLKINGKNRREVPVPESLVEEIRKYLKNVYLKEAKGSQYLFFSRDKNRPLSSRSVEIMFKKALLETGLSTRYRFSILRDSYVVHLIEKDFCIDTISELTGMKENKIQSKYRFYINLVKKNKIPNMLDFSDVA